MISLLSDELLEPLGGGLQLVVSPAHIFCTDSILLSYFSDIRSHETACDLGTGCGVIPLLWCKRGTGPITAVDIQEKACAQLEKSLALNHLEDRVTVLNADLRKKHPLLAPGSFDLVTMNPPYFAEGSGAKSASDSGKLARHETTCTLEDAVQAAAALLRFGGRFCLCQKPERLSDVVVALRNAKLELKRLRFVAQTDGKAPWLFLAEGKRGAKPGVRVEPPLVQQTKDGSDGEEMKYVFGDYRKEG